MSIGSGILSASLLVLFTFAACTAVPLVFEDAHRRTAFAASSPFRNARRDFSPDYACRAGDSHCYNHSRNGDLSGFHPDFSGNLFELWETSWSKHNTDVPHYINIAEKLVCKRWERSPSDRFYPMLPLLMRILNPVFHNSFVSAQIINTIATCLASGTAYLTLYGILGKKRSVHAALLSLLLPGAIFLNSPMTEPLFHAVLFLCVLLFAKHKFILSAVFYRFSRFHAVSRVVLAAAIFIEGVARSSETFATAKIRKTNYCGCCRACYINTRNGGLSAH